MWTRRSRKVDRAAVCNPPWSTVFVKDDELLVQNLNLAPRFPLRATHGSSPPLPLGSAWLVVRTLYNLIVEL